MRHIYWEDEKKAVQYLENYDPEYLSLIQKSTRVSNLQDKFSSYCDLAEITFTTEFPKWDKDVAVSIEDEFGLFWRKLLKYEICCQVAVNIDIYV